MKVLFPFLAFLFFSFPVFAEPVFDMPTQVEARIYESPIPMKADGKFYLVYEIHLTNFENSPRKISAIEVMDPSSPENAIASFDEKTLPKMLQEVGMPKLAPTGHADGTDSIKPGGRTVAFMWLEFDQESKIPANLTHRIIFEPDSPGATKKNIVIPAIPVKKIKYVILSKPVQGKRWYAGNGPSNLSNHRRAVLLLDGSPYIGQRFAIDWVKIGENNLTYKGNIYENSSYFAYNQDVFAAADGTVVKVINDVPENKPADPSRAVTMDTHTIAGNQVVMDLGGGMFALYAHLIPGSIRVKVGDRVKRGDVLAKLGNSGNSSEPHLHFQISDRPDFIASEGVPYIFDKTKVQKTKSEMNSAGIGPIDIVGDPPVQISDEFVLDGDLVDFS